MSGLDRSQESAAHGNARRRDSSANRAPPAASAAASAAQERPQRPLNAYNFFFQEERRKMLQTLPEPAPSAKPKSSHGKIGFGDMARAVSLQWRKTSEAEKAPFLRLAEQDKQRYYREMDAWYRRNNADDEQALASSDAREADLATLDGNNPTADPTQADPSEEQEEQDDSAFETAYAGRSHLELTEANDSPPSPAPFQVLMDSPPVMHSDLGTSDFALVAEGHSNVESASPFAETHDRAGPGADTGLPRPNSAHPIRPRPSMIPIPIHPIRAAPVASNSTYEESRAREYASRLELATQGHAKEDQDQLQQHAGFSLMPDADVPQDDQASLQQQQQHLSQQLSYEIARTKQQLYDLLQASSQDEQQLSRRGVVNSEEYQQLALVLGQEAVDFVVETFLKDQSNPSA